MNKFVMFATLLVTGIAQALTNQQATALVDAAFRNTVPSQEKKYCMNGVDETCRIMFSRKNRNTGKVEFFYDLFYSKNRDVSSITYFVPSQTDPRKFHVVADTILKDFNRQVNLISPLMAEIDTSFDQKNVIFYGLKMSRLGTTKYLLANMVQSENEVIIDGFNRDENDPSFKEKIKISYKRMANPRSN